MADKRMEVALIISAYDKATRVINAMTNNAIGKLGQIKKSSDAMAQQAFGFGRDAGMSGAAGAALLAGPIMAFGNLEEAALSLKSVMMKDGGVLDKKQFEAVSKLSTELGNKLPGNTKDFFEMFDTMIRNGVPAQNILDGTGKSAAYLAVALKLPYGEAGKMAAKLKEATGIADRDMLSFMDTIARTANVGVESGEMQYAFARSAGALKLMNMQGLDASKSLSAVYAMLIKTGASGETVGTGMTAVFNSFMNNKKMAALQDETKKLGITMDFVDKQTGQFKGVENMVAQFDRLKGLNPQQRANIVQAFLGPGADANFMNILIDKGVSGYNEMIDKMKNQADLNAKVESQLAGQKAMWEAASGTFENVLAMVGDLIGEDVKNFFNTLNNSVLPSLSKWIDQNKTLVKIIAYSIGVFTAAAIALSGIGFAAGLVMKGVSVTATTVKFFAGGIKDMQWALFKMRYTMVTQVIPSLTAFNATLIANPIGAIIAAVVLAIAAVAILVIKWKEITKWYRESSIWIKIMLAPLMIANSAIIGLAFAIRKVIDNWPAIKNFFTSIPKYVSNIIPALKSAGYNIVKAIAMGMIPGGNLAVDAIANITKKMREYLPFSPAKRGAFMDLHKVKIVETIAGSMRPAPLVKAMANTTKAAAGVSRSGGGGGSMTLNFNPVFNGISNPEEIKKMLKEFIPTIIREIEAKSGRKATLSF